MNERIKELAEQCVTRKFHVDHCNEEFDYGKFAELIVTECIEVCNRGKLDRKDELSNIQFNSGIRFCINSIDEHFGD